MVPEHWRLRSAMYRWSVLHATIRPPSAIATWLPVELHDREASSADCLACHAKSPHACEGRSGPSMRPSKARPYSGSFDSRGNPKDLRVAEVGGVTMSERQRDEIEWPLDEASVSLGLARGHSPRWRESSGGVCLKKSEPILRRIPNDRLRFAPAGRSGAAEFPPHPPSAAPSLLAFRRKNPAAMIWI